MVTIICLRTQNTVEPPNKGHVGGNIINSAVLSFGGSKCIRAIYRENNFWHLDQCTL